MIACVLAAGQATRFGRCKPLADINGQPMLRHVFNALPSSLGEKVVITGAYFEQVKTEAEFCGVRILHNPDYAKGIGTSIRVAAKYALEKNEDLLLTLADLPFVTTTDYEKLMANFKAQPVFSLANNQVCPPALFPRSALPKLLSLPDDRGAKSLFVNPAVVSISNAALDVDTEENLISLNSSFCPSALGSDD